MARSPGTPIARVAAEHQRRAALELALRPVAPEGRGPLIDSVAAAGDHPLGVLDALVVVVVDDEVLAAAWAQPSPGRAALLWPPEMAPPEAGPNEPVDAEAIRQALLRKAVAACDDAGVPLTQVLLEINDDPRIPALRAVGFRQMASLDYLGRRASISGEEAESPLEGLTYGKFGAKDADRLRRLLRATYVESLDCPGLDDLRDVDDSLESYRSTGRFDPNHWLFVQSGGVDVGVLLMTEHPDADQAELIYMGVTPEARGRGYGAAIVHQALRVAERMGVDQLMVAVDRANTPARNVYDRAGFAAWARRYVYVRTPESIHAVS